LPHRSLPREEKVRRWESARPRYGLARRRAIATEHLGRRARNRRGKRRRGRSRWRNRLLRSRASGRQHGEAECQRGDRKYLSSHTHLNMILRRQAAAMRRPAGTGMVAIIW